MDRFISTRENVVRCGKCKSQKSLTSYTPAHHFKLPIWVFSYLITEQIQQHPIPISGAQIHRRLGCSKNTAHLLKKRLMLFWGDLLPLIKEKFKDELREAWNDEKLPKTGDLSAIVKNKPVVHIDTLAFFSAKQRANGFRARKRMSGQTASIYLSDKVALERGKCQIGTLTHTMAVKGGPVFLSSVPNQKQKTLAPLLDDLPRGTVVFGDEGYPWLWRSRVLQFRGVKHSARAKDRKRNVWARNRFNRDGVNNNAAEGVQRIVKHAMTTAHSYFSPESSSMRLNEWSAIKGLRVYGLDGLIEGAGCGKVGGNVF